MYIPASGGFPSHFPSIPHIAQKAGDLQDLRGGGGSYLFSLNYSFERVWNRFIGAAFLRMDEIYGRGGESMIRSSFLFGKVGDG